MSVGSFSNDDGDGNENVKKAIGLLSKTTSLHVHHAFLYISLPLLHDYDVKMPSFTFYGGRKTSDDKLFFLFLNLSAVPKKSTSGKLAYISYFQRIEVNATKLEKRQFILKVMFSVLSPLSMLVPSFNRCVGYVLNMSKKWQRNLHSLFTMKDLSRSLLTSQVEASSES